MTVPGTSGQPGLPAPSRVEEVLLPEGGQNKIKRRTEEKNAQALPVDPDRATPTPVVSVNHTFYLSHLAFILHHIPIYLTSYSIIFQKMTKCDPKTTKVLFSSTF